MQRIILSALLVSTFSLFTWAQEPAKNPAVDKIGQEASKLEAELGKFKDTSPQAADILVKLVDLYHADGRVFGLVRAAQTFAASHPGDPRHEAVMLKLIDGLEATSRNQDLSSALRQFLARYPKNAQCPSLEIRLAHTLGQMTDRKAAADAYRIVWKRNGNTPIGREAGVSAISFYAAAGGTPNISSGAELAEEMLDSLPLGTFASEVGWQGMNEWRRINQFAKSNVIGNKLLKKNKFNDPERLRQVHALMGENYWQQAQYANGVTSWRAARGIRDDQYSLYYLIENLYRSDGKSNVLEPLVNEYLNKYPTRFDRHSRQSQLALAYLREGNKPKALSLLAGLLPLDAVTNSNVLIYVRENGAEEAQAKQQADVAAAATKTALDNAQKDKDTKELAAKQAATNVTTAKTAADKAAAALKADANNQGLKNADAAAKAALTTAQTAKTAADTALAAAIKVLADADTKHKAALAQQTAAATALAAKYAESERVLRDAITKNTDHAYYLRYILAIELYRDRVKDVAKTKQMLREFLAQSPSNDGNSWTAISWLLDNAADENEFRADVARIIASRRQFVHLANHRQYLGNWATNIIKSKNKELKPRGEFVKAELNKQDNDAFVFLWLQHRYAYDAKDANVREQLLTAPMLAKLSDQQFRSLVTTQAYYYRHYAPAKQRVKTTEMESRLSQRFPKEYAAAVAYLVAATDYSPAEEKKKAAAHMLTFEPESLSADVWRRLMIAADQNKDAAMGKQVYAWITKSQQKFGNHYDYASQIGDALLRLGLENEAVQHWTTYLTYQRNTTESRECASRLLARLPDDQKQAFLQKMFAPDTDYHGRYAQWMADLYLAAGDLNNFERVLRETRKRQDERPFRGWDLDWWAINTWTTANRANEKATDADKQRVYAVIRDLHAGFGSVSAELSLLELAPPKGMTPMQRLLAYQKATRTLGDAYYDWDALVPFAQGALSRKDYVAAATLTTGMLSNITGAGADRHKAGRAMVAQSYSRMGSVGLTIDEDSPMAPLMQAALYLRLGDDNLAFETYTANKALFNQFRNDVPTDLLLFVCERRIAAGGDENHDAVEEILRGWIVKHSESTQHDETTKAKIQLLLARNYFKAQRYDVARGEFTTVINRYAETPQAIEAEFGIGETFMAQKVYDQAELIFEKLANSREIQIVVRAEFLRGVLAFRRGDHDDARDIFRSVLERVPDVDLANQTLFNLSEVYGVEERYLDQLNLLRTVGRLGAQSKRRHTPGMPLSIVVHDSDLGISRGHSRIAVIVTTQPGGDEERIDLTSAGAGKGLFRADLDTGLGSAQKRDGVLQLTGRDIIKCDYPQEFKAEFKNVPLSDVEISVASSAKFEVSSSKIVDVEKETFSQRLEREAREKEQADLRVSQGRPANQVKPGNSIYLRVKDPDRDLGDEADEVVVKLASNSGDQVQAVLKETGPHTGMFEGNVPTGELPAGALASDTAIEHNPLMAIDRDPKTYWMSEPDGATPKTLTVDLKDLKRVSRVRIYTPDVDQHAPVRGKLMGSYDGEFWFRLAGHPDLEVAAPVADEFGQMTGRVYNGNHYTYTTWNQVASLGKNGKTIDEKEVEELTWVRPAEEDNSAKPFAVIWHGKFVHPRDGALRINIKGTRTALAINGRVELPVGPGGRSVDLWLESGAHDLTIFSASSAGQQDATATMARANLESAQVNLVAFRPSDFDLTQPAAKTASRFRSQPNDIPLLAGSAQLEKRSETFGLSEDKSYIGNWKDVDDRVSWGFRAIKPGAYDVFIDSAHSGGGSKYAIEFGQQVIEGTMINTGGWTTFRKQQVGTILINETGQHTLTLKPVEIGASANLMNLRGISLQPAEGARRIVLDNFWEFRFKANDLRYVRFIVDEYLGEAVAISNVEVAGERANQIYIPTKEDVLSLATNNVLEIAGGDVVTATYTDEFRSSDLGASQLLTAELMATYYNANVSPIAYDFSQNGGGGVQTTRKELLRVDPGERIIVEIVDYDEDRTAERDTVKFDVTINDSEPIELIATETEEFSGVFTKELDTAAGIEEGKLTVKMGDRIYCRYRDTQNTFPGHSVPRESVVFVNQPTKGLVRVLQSRVELPPPESKAKPTVTYSVPPGEAKVSGVALTAPLTIEVIDPDQAKDSRSSVVVTLKTTDGATIKVRCIVSEVFAKNLPVVDNPALLEGRFIGQVVLQLGGKDTPDIVPLTSEMPRNLVGGAIINEEESSAPLDNLVTRVLNLTGKDLVTATYTDERRPGEEAVPLDSQARLIVDGVLACTDREYEKPIDRLHVGEKLFLKVDDADRDSSDERDVVLVEISTEAGEKETIELVETFAHSGIFTGSLMLKASEKPTAGNLNPEDPIIECYFGNKIKTRYLDVAASSGDGTLELTQELPVVVGTNGLVLAFTKIFNDENLAVETKFHIAESYFELFKSHKELKRDEEIKVDLEAGRRVLREVMEDYPDPKYTPRIAYLLGQFAQELQQWNEAIKSYDMIIRQFPDHSLAADAQYKLAQSYEEAGNFDEALEGYVTLAATYPKSPLIASVMIRISDHFYKGEEYDVAAQVGEKFLEKFEGHQHAPRMAFRVGQCYYKAKEYVNAADAFDRFAKKFPDDKLCSQSLFWSGESFRMANNNLLAFQRYNRCRWDFPATEAAKYARGRLTLPEMLQQFEAAVNSLDEDK